MLASRSLRLAGFHCGVVVELLVCYLLAGCWWIRYRGGFSGGSCVVVSGCSSERERKKGRRRTGGGCLVTLEMEVSGGVRWSYWFVGLLVGGSIEVWCLEKSLREKRWVRVGRVEVAVVVVLSGCSVGVKGKRAVG